MKKLFFSLAALIICCTGIQAANVKVTVKMNSTSPWMSLVDKVTQDTVAVGDADSQTYTFDVPDGTYVLTAYAKDSATAPAVETPAPCPYDKCWPAPIGKRR